MAVRCKACGVESTYHKAFQTEWSWRGRSYRCPSCTQRETERRARSDRWVWLITPLLAIFCVATARTTDGLLARMLQGYAWLFANLTLFQVFLVAQLLPHELGHALAAYLLRCRIFMIVIGTGPLIRDRVVAGIRFRICRYPLGGLTVTAPQDGRYLRLRWFAVIAAGPAVNAVFLATMLPFLGSYRAFRLEKGPAFALMFAAANVLLLVINLVPISRVPPFGIPNDGFQLVTIPFANRARLEKMLAANYILEASVHHEGNRLDEAVRCLEQGLRAHPESPDLHQTLGATLCLTGDYERAREHFLRVVASPDSDPAVLATAKNNVAWVDVVTMPNDRLDEADRLSEEALKVVGWVPAIKGTRGVVLVEKGQVEQGLVLLRDALSQVQGLHPLGRATYSAAMALGLAKQGQYEQAAKFLDLAKKHHPSCPVVPRIEAIVTAGGAPSQGAA